MHDSVPSIAPLGPPLIGESMKCAPFSVMRRAKSTVAVAEMVLQSMTTASFLIDSE
jgi:hypothetical protein